MVFSMMLIAGCSEEETDFFIKISMKGLDDEVYLVKVVNNHTLQYSFGSCSSDGICSNVKWQQELQLDIIQRKEVHSLVKEINSKENRSLQYLRKGSWEIFIKKENGFILFYPDELKNEASGKLLKFVLDHSPKEINMDWH